MPPRSPAPSVPIAVVGLSTLVPGSSEAAGFWRDVAAGRDLITEVPASHWLPEDHYDADPAARDKTYATRGSFLSPVDFDPLAFATPPSSIPATDSAQLLALVAAQLLLRDVFGDRSPTAEIRERTGIILGACSTELMHAMSSRSQRPTWRRVLRAQGLREEQTERLCDALVSAFPEWQESSFPGLLTNVVAGRVARHFDLHGSNYTTDAACASSLSALSACIDELVLGRADMMLTGGVDPLSDAFSYTCFSKTPALSPSGDCRPFSADADGTLLGEAVIMLALKRLGDAERAGDRIYAVIRGIGSSSDGRGSSIYAPTAAGQVRALRRAYEAAGYGPGTVELVEAHGTGTRAGDETEAAALQEAFGADPPSAGTPWCALGSVKSQIGHTKAAAGAAGLAKAVLALHHRTLPPTLKAESPTPALDTDSGPFYLSHRTRPWVRGSEHPRRASVSSFGFGGTNFHIALEEYTPQDGSPHRQGLFRTAPDELVLISASSASALTRDLGRLSETVAPLTETARTSQEAFDATASHRWCTVVRDLAALRAAAADSRARILQQPDTAFVTPGGTRYQSGTGREGRVALLFPGQGSQYPGMGAEVALHVPQALSAWDRLADVDIDGRPLHRSVFPPPASNDAQREAQDRELEATERAQPALAAHALVMRDVLLAVGFRPDCVAGHSFGELTALHAAGACSDDTLMALASTRGRLLRDAGTVPGAMLALQATAEQTAHLVNGIEDLWVANDNAPGQHVLSGSTAAIDRARTRAAERRIPAQRLAVSSAFHSPLLASATEDWRSAVAKAAFTPAQLPVYSNVTAQPYPASASEALALLTDHLTSTVRFTDTVRALYEDGVRLFVEAGPGTVLTGLVSQILAGEPHTAVSADHRTGSGLSALHKTLGTLSVAGHPLDCTPLWSAYATAPSPPPRRSMSIPIAGPNSHTGYRGTGGPTEDPPRDTPRAPDAARPHAPEAPGDTRPATPAAWSVPAGHPHDPAVRDLSAVPPGAPSSAAPDQEHATASDLWLRAFLEVQQHAATAHSQYQELTSSSHAAFLDLARSTLGGLSGLLAGNTPGTSEELPVLPPAEPHLLPVTPSPAEHQQSTRPRAVPATADASAGTATQAEVMQRPPHLTSPALVDDRRSPVAKEERGAGGKEEERGAGGNATGQAPGGIVLAVVAELTGYPVEMLTPSLDLEVDLGVDSLKRVQILSRLSEHFPNETDIDPAELINLRTIAEIADKLAGLHPTGESAPRADHSSPASAPSAPRPPTTPSLPAQSPSRAEVVRTVLTLEEAEAAGPPVTAHLDGLPLYLTRDALGVATPLAALLQRAGVEATVVDQAPAGARALVILDGLQPAPAPHPPGADAVELPRRVLQRLRALGPELTRDAGVLVTVQDTGGDFGVRGASARADSAALAALARTAASEWRTARVKAIDIDCASRTPQQIAQALADELLDGDLAGNVALATDGTRRVLQDTPQHRAEPQPLDLGEDPVVVVSGGARGITSLCVRALACAHRPKMLLLGRTELIDEDDELRAADSEAAVRSVLARHTTPGADTSLRDLAQGSRAVLASREVRTTLDLLTEAGADVRYVRTDVRDREAVQDALAAARRDWGPITALLHGAGVLADQHITDKSDAEFTEVFITKVEGLANLLDATRDDPLRLLCVFSSVSARVGTAGQCDYAAANETVEHLAAIRATLRPDCRTKAISWGPWSTGMVTSAHAEHFRRLGVALLTPQAGTEAFLAELDQPTPVRVGLAAGPTGTAASASHPAQQDAFTEITLAPDTQPWLRDHRIAGRPVVPVALVLEWFIHAASTAAPSGRSPVLRDLTVLKAIALEASDEGSHRLDLRTSPEESGVRLNLDAPDGTRHYTATATWENSEVLEGPPAPAAESTGDRSADEHPGLDVYNGGMLFHGPALQAIETVGSLDAEGATGTLLGTADLNWPQASWHSDPALLDGAFQLAALWVLSSAGIQALPMGVREARLRLSPPAGTPVRCVVRAVRHGSTNAVCDIWITSRGREPAEVLVVLKGVELVHRMDVARQAPALTADQG
ncbi:SDR family NAD(P)-dependent oxidoreductase [Streptomyces sp. NPDC005876]|uniref:SDR family NAD(P)-dependent oxidoreductase n=1 Tax=Streptomyces sp. NPDC005876 TaxID=3157076 RepID=UPI0033C7FBF9